MRNWIDLFESTMDGVGLGKLYNSHHDESAVGYWYHPQTGEYHIITWEAYKDYEGTYYDHADVVFDHPDWFGLTAEDLKDADDGDVARYGAVLKSWVRVGFNPLDGLRMDARSPRDAFLTLKWFVSHHSQPIKVLIIDLVSEDAITSYRIPQVDLGEYLSTGRLQPAWKTVDHRR